MKALKTNESVEAENSAIEIMKSESGAMGYLVAWLLGVPASILFAVFLLRAIF